MNVSGFFSSYSTTDPEGKKTATSLLSTMIIVALSLLPVILTFRLINEFKLYPADIVILVLIPIFFSLYLLLKRGNLIITGLLFFSVTWVAMTVMAANGLGIRDVTIIGYILIVFVAVLITGYRVAIIFTLLSIFAIWVMAIAEAKGILIPPEEPPLVYARDFTIMITLLLTGILLYERSFRYSYQRINKELSEKISAEEKLSQNEGNLIIQNEELRSAKLRAEESDKLKSAFLQNISHEIRTPMNGIVGFAELLKDPDLVPEKSEEYTELMMSCSDQLAAVINDLIDISKIEVGAVELNLSEFLPDSILNDIRILFRTSVAEKGIQFIVRNDLPDLLIRSDRGKITRILNNLVNNAVKFTSSGKVEIHAWQSGNNLRINVTDTGLGIESGEIEYIFDRFRQGESGMTRNFGGSGLGLAICKGNLEYLGGTIDVKSEEGKGSSFTISIPVEFTEKSTSENYAPTELKTMRKIKTLVAEDDDISFLYLSSILRNENFEILRAMTGVEAVSVFYGNTDIDLVLMDLKLPEMSGFEAAGRIRDYNDAIPILAISAYAFEEDKQRASESGINDYISKPFKKNDLIIKINKYVSGLY